MTREERGQVARAWALLGEYFRQPLQDVVIGMYVEDVAHLDMRQVLTVLRSLRVEAGRQRCPTPGDVLRRMKELRPDASELAATITGSFSRFGYTAPERARTHIGPVGWRAVEAFGGWQHLCNTVMTSQLGTLRAQLRDTLEAIMARDEHAEMTHRALPGAAGQGMPGLAQGAPPDRRSPCQTSMQPTQALSLANRLMGNC